MYNYNLFHQQVAGCKFEFKFNFDDI